MEFLITEKICPEDEKAIRSGLLEYNREAMERAECRDLGIFLEGEDGKKAGGLIGYTHGKWLFIKWLWVDASFRGEGVGSKILQQAEATARDRGCTHSMLDTFEFQAPGFYQKYGFETLFVLEEHPATGKHYFLTKRL